MISHHVTDSQLLLIVGCWAVVAWRIRHAQRNGASRAAQALSVAIGALALSITVQFGAGLLDQTLGVPNVGRLLSNCATLIACCAAQAFVVYLWHPTREATLRARRAWAQLAVVLPIVFLLFVITPTDFASSRADPRHATAVYSSPYVYVYLGYLAYCLIRILRELRRCLRLVTDFPLRLTLNLTMGGCVTGLAYVSFKLFYLIGHDLNVRLPGREIITATPMYIVSIGLFALCLAVPPIRNSVAALQRWIRQYCSYQRLYPLWQAVYRATPTVALDPRPSRLRSRLTVRDLDYLLYRRVIEIRDGQLALLDRTSNPDAGRPTSGHICHETQQLLYALHRWTDDARTGRGQLGLGSADLTVEIRSLERLAKIFANSRRDSEQLEGGELAAHHPRPSFPVD